MSKRVLFIAFLIIIFLPITLSIFGWGSPSANHENRRLQDRPAFDLSGEGNLIQKVSKFKDQYNTYYEDNFVMKPLLFKTYSSIQTNLFNTNSIPNKVVKGTEGWYFLGDYDGKPILESKGIINFSADQLAIIKSNVLNQALWAEQNDIKYYVAIAPNKHSIYGDYLAIEQSSAPTKLQQVKSELSNEQINFIDLGDNLRDHSDLLLYDRTNTHWNGNGSYLAYLQIMDALKQDFPLLTPLSHSQINIFTKYVEFDELTGMLSLPGNYERIETEIVNPQFTPLSSKIDAKRKYSPGTYERRFSISDKPLKVLVFRDSFAGGLIKYLRESFGETVFLWSYEFDKELILKEKPDIVISEIVERNIDVLLEEYLTK